LQFERSRQARFERDAVRHAQTWYSELGSECDDDERTARALMEAVCEEFGEHTNTNESMAFVWACVLNAFDGLKRSLDDRRFAELCVKARGEVLQDSMLIVLPQCDEPSVSLEMFSRVTGIVDLEAHAPPASASLSAEQFTISSQGNVGSLQSAVSAGVEVLGADAQGGSEGVSEKADNLVSGALGSVQLSGAADVVVLDADERGEGVGCSDKAEESAVGSPRVSDGLAVASAKAKPKRRLKRVQSDDAEAMPVRRSARIATRSRHADVGASSSRRGA
jgi:hypothetical protein